MDLPDLGVRLPARPGENIASDAPDQFGARFTSILDRPESEVDYPPEPPPYFHDLNLDQVVLAITAGKQEYKLPSFFYAPLKTVDDICYRQQVMRDVESAGVLQSLKNFAATMRFAREQLGRSDKLYYKQQKERWFLTAAQTYCTAVATLYARLSELALSSAGLCGFRDYLDRYLRSERFVALRESAAGVVAHLNAVRYCILIGETKFQVRRYDDEADYTAQVSATFEKFRQAAAKDYRVEFPETTEMNHIEAKVVEFVRSSSPKRSRRWRPLSIVTKGSLIQSLRDSTVRLSSTYLISTI